MKITRNGVEYELTQEELRKAYEEKDLEYTQEDVEYKLAEMEIEGANRQQIKKIIDGFKHRLDDHDLHWDIYWSVMENIIEEVMEGTNND